MVVVVVSGGMAEPMWRVKISDSAPEIIVTA